MIFEDVGCVYYDVRDDPMTNMTFHDYMECECICTTKYYRYHNALTKKERENIHILASELFDFGEGEIIEEIEDEDD